MRALKRLLNVRLRALGSTACCLLDRWMYRRSSQIRKPRMRQVRSAKQSADAEHEGNDADPVAEHLEELLGTVHVAVGLEEQRDVAGLSR